MSGRVGELVDSCLDVGRQQCRHIDMTCMLSRYEDMLRAMKIASWAGASEARREGGSKEGGQGGGGMHLFELVLHARGFGLRVIELRAEVRNARF